MTNSPARMQSVGVISSAVTTAPEDKSTDASSIEIILLEKTDGGQFSKTIELSPEGQALIVTQAPDGLTNMTAKRLRLDETNPLGSLIKVIEKLTGNQSLAMGRLPSHASDDALPVVLSEQPGDGNHGKNWITRTTADTAYAKGLPAPVLLDFDYKDYPQHIQDKVEALGGPLKALLVAVPELADTTMIFRPSTSSGIHRVSDGQTFPGGGLHAYLMLADGSQSAEFLKVLQDRLWEAGLGYIKVNKGGICQKACIIDTTVGRSERPCYEAPPNLGSGLKQMGRVTQTLKGSVGVLSLEAVQRADSSSVAALFASAMDAPAIRELVHSRIQEKHQELVAVGVTPAQAKKITSALYERQKVPLSYDLYPFKKIPMGLRIIDLLEDPDRWDGTTMADPIEGPGYNPNIAQFYANRGSSKRPKIHSFAHGGIIYDLASYGVEDAVDAVQGGIDLDRIVRALRMTQQELQTVLAVLGSSGVEVDARAKRRALEFSQTEQVAKSARTVLEFAKNPLPGFPIADTGFLDGLRKIAAKQEAKGAPPVVSKWLGAKKAALAKMMLAETEVRLEANDLRGAFGPLDVQSLADFIDSTAPRKSVVKPLGLYHQTTNTWTANPNEGKTAIALEVSFALALGEELFGRRLQPMHVLYLAGENYGDIRARVKLMCIERGVDPKHVKIDIRKGGFNFAEHHEKVLMYTGAKKYGMVVVDTLAAHFFGTSENDNTEMQRYFDSFAKVANGPGIPAVVVLAHPSAETGKLEAQRRLHDMRARGASSVQGTIDSNLTIAKLPGGIVQAHLQKRRSKQVSDVFFRFKTMSDPSVVDGDGDVEETVRAEPITEAQAQFSEYGLETRVLKELDRDSSLSVRSLAVALAPSGERMAIGTVQNVLNKLEDEGLIQVDRSGGNRKTRREITKLGRERLLVVS